MRYKKCENWRYKIDVIFSIELNIDCNLQSRRNKIQGKKTKERTNAYLHLSFEEQRNISWILIEIFIQEIEINTLYVENRYNPLFFISNLQNKANLEIISLWSMTNEESQVCSST